MVRRSYFTAYLTYPLSPQNDCYNNSIGDIMLQICTFEVTGSRFQKERLPYKRLIISVLIFKPRILFLEHNFLDKGHAWSTN